MQQHLLVLCVVDAYRKDDFAYQLFWAAQGQGLVIGRLVQGCSKGLPQDSGNQPLLQHRAVIFQVDDQRVSAQKK